MKQKTQDQLQKQIDNFNQKYKVSDKVKIEKDNGNIEIVTVKHEATIMGGHTAVGWFEQISGAYLLERVKGAA